MDMEALRMLPTRWSARVNRSRLTSRSESLGNACGGPCLEKRLDLQPALFDELDRYTRQVVDFHHPGVPVRLERAFGAYYEGEREGFHLGVNEHRDGDANLVSTVVHATLPDGDCGFTGGGELTIAAEGGLPKAPITHSNATVGSVVYIGPKVFHDAKPIKLGGKRLVFCMFYAAEEGRDLRTSRSSWTRFARGPPEV